MGGPFRTLVHHLAKSGNPRMLLLPHFINEETEAQNIERLAQDYTAIQWQSQD